MAIALWHFQNVIITLELGSKIALLTFASAPISITLIISRVWVSHILAVVLYLSSQQIDNVMRPD